MLYDHEPPAAADVAVEVSDTRTLGFGGVPGAANAIPPPTTAATPISAATILFFMSL
jgi:hypothetical protein